MNTDNNNITGAKRGKFTQALIALLLAAAVIAAYLTVLAAVSLCTGVAVGISHRGLSEEELTNILYEYASLSSLIGNLIALGILTAVILISKRSIVKTLKLKAVSPVTVLLCIVIGISLNFFADCAVTLIPFPESIMNTYDEMYSFLGEGNPVVEIAGVVLITPIAEEVFFRAASYGIMRRRMSVWAAVAVSAVFFGVAHGNVVSFVFTSLLGAVLALIFEKSGSVFAPIAVHASFNASSYILPEIMKEPSDVQLAAVCAASGAVFALTFALFLKYIKKKTPIPEAENGE